MSGALFPTNAREQVKPDVLLRTRRSVMEAAHLMHAKRARQRRHAGIALLAVVGLLTVFAPVLWGAASDLTSGDHLLDMPVVLLALTLVFLSAMFAVVLMQVRSRKRSIDNE
jgi:DMSO/TMAO reductase YedYZ heme-binding membrane subunit